ncbi:MAG: ParA family protein [Myxococcota bacterium]
MIVLSIASQKGGVGKTTVALNLAFALGVRGWKTLLIDVDPQGAIGLSLNTRVSEAAGLIDVALGRSTLEQVLVHTHVPGLSLMPAGTMSYREQALFERALQEQRALEQVLARCRESGGWEVVLLDTPAGFTVPMVSSLWASSHVITPLQAEPVALRVLPRFLERIRELRTMGAGLKLAGIVLTMVGPEDGADPAGVRATWSQYPEAIRLGPPIPRDAVFLEASSAGVPVGLLRRNPPPVARTFEQLAIHLEPRLGLKGRPRTEEGPLPFVD